MTNSYRLTMDGELVDYYKTKEDAYSAAKTINKNRVRSSDGKKKPQRVKIVYDAPDETRTVYED